MFRPFADLLATGANATSTATASPSSGPAATTPIFNFIAFLMNLIFHLYKYILAHPFQATYDAFTTALFFRPGAFTGPVLRALGFTQAGPAAGSWAARWMSEFGPIVARGWYAVCQSAQMGGYGAAILGELRGFAVVLQGVGAALRFMVRG